ncbi:tumor necrosis factor ligand superfamily member 6 isoform X1 [Salarias fasciatus]|uniref:tumor necrosis factor ligand superfamily member 6 isoform X1 n=2 Tax=Salarias fasciatus TaxID=181472 RepID=UPI001176A7C6|nr:tumor necrosis factor ligand superfamily member 6-like isoform X1 [Salarias fasciatus]
MSCDQSCSFPQVFLVDGRPQHPPQPPGHMPFWSFPPAQERVRHRGKSRSSMGVSAGLTVVVLLLFLLVFAALGFEAYQIFNIQKEVRDMKKIKPVTDVIATEKHVGLLEPGKNEENKNSRSAAHVIGRIEKDKFLQTLRWESRSGQAFTSGLVTYWVEDGALQVNETGLYHVYSRVELLLRDCSPKSSFDHLVYVRRKGNTPPIVLMKAHRAGFCSHQTPRLSWTAESYLGSVHQLRKYDRVFVNVSHPADLSHSHDGNFFGLYMI